MDTAATTTQETLALDDRQLPHSRLGIASVVLFASEVIVGFLTWLASGVAWQIVFQTRPAWFALLSTTLEAAGWLLSTMPFVGFGLGVAGLFGNQTRKILPAVGTSLNGILSILSLLFIIPSIAATVVLSSFFETGM